jgi:hypothetical protein
MKNVNESETAVTASEAATVEDILGDLEIEDAGSSSIVELDAHDEAVIETMVAAEGAYDDQPTSTSGIETAPTAAPTAEKKAPKEKKARTPRELSALDPDVFGAADEAGKDAVITSRPTQKKIAEKFDNLFQSIAANKKPSTYTVACLNVLLTKGTATSADMVGALKAGTVSHGKTKGAVYNEGTARSQAGQLMALFATVGIATREKQVLTLNSGSPLVAKLKTILAA